MNVKLPAFLPAAAGAYLVGGCVRDLLTDRPPADYDVVVLGDPRAYAERIAAANGGRVVVIGRPGLQVWRVVFTGAVCDVSAAPEGGLAADLLRRDFTINALALDIAGGAIIDVTGGRTDLARKTIRSVSDFVFTDDPVRLLRAFRLAAVLGFRIEPGTMTAIGRDSSLIARTAGERVRDELLKLLSSPRSQAPLRDMAATGLLEAVVPELKRTGTPRRLEHALNVHGWLEDLFVRWESFEPPVAARLARAFTVHRQALIKCGAVLNPIGEGFGEIHPQAEDPVVATVRRLRFSNRDAERLEFMIRRSSLPLEAFASPPPTNRAAVRLFRAAGDHLPDLLLHTVADCEADSAKPDTRSRCYCAWARGLLRDYFFTYIPRVRSPRPITGRDLIREFGLTPSPLFARLLELVEEERLSRDGVDREMALQIVREALAGHRA